MYVEYLCRSWQDLLEAIKRLVGNEYNYFHITVLPDHKDDKYLEIDKKLINKYGAFYQKDEYYRKKKKGLSNFRYLRWNNIVVILHTEGTVITSEKIKNRTDREKLKYVKSVNDKGLLHRFNRREIEKYEIEYDDEFSYTRESPIFLNIGNEVSFAIQRVTRTNPKKRISSLESEIKQLKAAKSKNQKKPPDKRKNHDYDRLIGFKQKKIENLKKEAEKERKKESVEVKLDKDYYRELKVTFSELAERKNSYAIIKYFDMLNGLPPHSGILKQQWLLRKHILALSKKHHFKLDPNDVQVRNRLVVSKSLYHLINVGKTKKL